MERDGGAAGGKITHGDDNRGLGDGDVGPVGILLVRLENRVELERAAPLPRGKGSALARRSEFEGG